MGVTMGLAMLYIRPFVRHKNAMTKKTIVITQSHIAKNWVIQKNWKIRESLTNLDDIEIYSDYGGGFYWDGTGSESEKVIVTFLVPFDQCPKDIKYGQSEWVKDFLHHIYEI